MANITVTLSDTQTKSLEYMAYSVQDWANIAQEEIIAKLVAHCNANSIAIATGADAQVTQAYSLSVVDTAKNIEDSREDSDTP